MAVLIVTLVAIALVAIVKLIWLAFHPKVHISFPILFLAVAAFFIPVLNYVLFGGLILFAVNPWNVPGKFGMVLETLVRQKPPGPRQLHPDLLAGTER